MKYCYCFAGLCCYVISGFSCKFVVPDFFLGSVYYSWRVLSRSEPFLFFSVNYRSFLRAFDGFIWGVFSEDRSVGVRGLL